MPLKHGFMALALSLMLGTAVYAAPIFGGVTTEDGQQVGICLGQNPPPECDGVNCSNPVYRDDVRCLSEIRVGTGLAEGQLSATGITHTDNAGDLVLKFINFILPYLALAAFLAFVAAGVMYVTAFQNEEQTGKAKNMMKWALIGIVIVIASYAIVQFLIGGLLGRL